MTAKKISRKHCETAFGKTLDAATNSYRACASREGRRKRAAWMFYLGFTPRPKAQYMPQEPGTTYVISEDER